MLTGGHSKTVCGDVGGSNYGGGVLLALVLVVTA